MFSIETVVTNKEILIRHIHFIKLRKANIYFVSKIYIKSQGTFLNCTLHDIHLLNANCSLLIYFRLFLFWNM